MDIRKRKRKTVRSRENEKVVVKNELEGVLQCVGVTKRNRKDLQGRRWVKRE